MKTKAFALVACGMLVGALLIVNAGGASVAMPGQPLVTFVIVPKKTIIPLDVKVNIPDPNLDSALHSATGIPQGDPIRASDLGSLAGTLDLSGKGIADAEGLQYCTKVAKLVLSTNELTSLPDSLKKLTKLTELQLTRNKFETFPLVLVELPALKTLNLSSNHINSLPDNNSSFDNLETLIISGNKLTALPVWLGSLVKLQRLDASYNEIKSIPKELFGAPQLRELYLSGNYIEELPEGVTGAPMLQQLTLQYNKLTALPEGIGNAPQLYILDVGFNNLTRIEPSLCSGKIKYLSVQGNRIKQLPDAMNGKSFTMLSVEWNFLDLAQGTQDRAILDSVNINAGNLFFERQLSPVALVSASSTESSIGLQWKPLAGGSAAGDSWVVLNYKVYDSGPNPDKLLDTLDEAATECTLTGLEAGHEYSLYVKVFYDLTVSGHKTTTSCSTSTKVTTKSAQDTAAPTASASPEDTPSAEVTVSPSPSPEVTVAEEATATPEATGTATAAAAVGSATGAPGDAQGRSSSVLLLVLIIVGSLIAVALIALVVVLIVRKPGGSTKIRYKL